jgi:hypothetical protein
MTPLYKYLAVLLLFFTKELNSCSAYKITAYSKTMVGTNYDTWLTTPRIWFEATGYGASFTGARLDGESKFAPQTGLNEFGLAFVTLGAAPPENGIPPKNKKQILSRTEFLKDILHKCKTVEEVKAYIEQYDHSSFTWEIFLYVDGSGKYLIVEPYVLTLGNEPKYVQANFCPSTITDFRDIKQVRYINGTAFLKNKIDSSLAFCTQLSDTMHVCRARIGDGTLLTSILDLNQKITHLYFYHDYKHHVQFNLKEELAKGDHFFEIPPLFPPNAEFKRLVDYKTPYSSAAIELFLLSCAVLYIISSASFLVSYLRKRKTTKFAYIKFTLFIICFVMLYYIFVLGREENIFYFPAPYKDYKFSLVNIVSYMPFVMLFLIMPLVIVNWKIFKENSWSVFQKVLFTLNNVSYLTLIFLFMYWGLYNVFN